MKTIKVSEATSIQLDWLVAKCEGFDTRNDCIVEYMNEQDSDDMMEFVCMADDEEHARDQLTDAYPESTFVSAYWQEFNITADWGFCGPIIERECIATYASGACSVSPKNPDYWVAEILDTSEMVTQYGPTPLIAAMRCYVCSVMGEIAEIPEELL